MVACSWKSWTKESQSWTSLIWKLTFSTQFQNYEITSNRTFLPKVRKRTLQKERQWCRRSSSASTAPLLLPVKACFSLVPTSVPFGCVLHQCCCIYTVWLYLSFWVCCSPPWTQQQQAINVKIKTKGQEKTDIWVLMWFSNGKKTSKDTKI